MRHKKTPILEGGRIVLRPILIQDAQQIVNLSQQYPENTKNFTFFDGRKISVQDERQYLRNMKNSPSDFLWTIHLAVKSEELCCNRIASIPIIGTVGLHEYDPYLRSARLGIIMWDKCKQGKGYGSEAISTALRFGFAELNLQRIDAVVRSKNLKGLTYYTGRLGFAHEGTKKDAYLLDNRWEDLELLAMTRHRWINLHAKPTVI